MPNDPVPSHVGPSDHEHCDLRTRDMRRHLVARLLALRNVERALPMLSIVGMTTTECVELDHGVDAPEDTLLGFRLPARCCGIGVVASSVAATPTRRCYQDAGLAIGVSRDGMAVSLLSTRTGVISTTEPQGWVIDACRRALDLPTPPSDVAPLALPVALWLDRLMVQIVQAPPGDRLRWADAVDLCPIPARWRSIEPVDLGTTLGSTTRSWSALRMAVSKGTPSPVHVKPSWARWMDDAMFARWCMGSFPDLANLRADVEFLAPPDVAENVEITLRSAWLATSI